MGGQMSDIKGAAAYLTPEEYEELQRISKKMRFSQSQILRACFNYVRKRLSPKELEKLIEEEGQLEKDIAESTPPGNWLATDTGM